MINHNGKEYKNYIYMCVYLYMIYVFKHIIYVCVLICIYVYIYICAGFPDSSVGKESACNAG